MVDRSVAQTSARLTPPGLPRRDIPNARHLFRWRDAQTRSAMAIPLTADYNATRRQAAAHSSKNVGQTRLARHRVPMPEGVGARRHLIV